MPRMEKGEKYEQYLRDINNIATTNFIDWSLKYKSLKHLKKS
jgi:hypothetical protein